jgi:hypothetical protein
MLRATDVKSTPEAAQPASGKWRPGSKVLFAWTNSRRKATDRALPEKENAMIKTIAIAVVVLIAAFLVYAATRPDTFRVRRAASIKALPKNIFALINDLHSWDAWSPYEKKDPAMKRTYSGAPRGKGAEYAWDGNWEVGKGRIEITESFPPSKVAMNLDMIKPFEAHNIVEFTLETTGGSTNVTWAMRGTMPYISKIMSVFFNMDKMIGKDFETGLAGLKMLVEK